MREIEFRGKPIEYKWNSRKKEYIPVVKKDWVVGKLLTNNRIITLTDERVEAMPCFDMCGYQKLVDIETIGQYIGLKDKNGRKIFEGDIIYFANKNYPLIVVWDEYKWGLADPKDTGPSVCFMVKLANDCEIIGNIYDNPELLEENKL